ncbi:hypothetical protein EI94DRAFT_1798905 [Lactarius quietus]|nr:hypothetical protein EI94DRAFT_1798905 [Lactarius quietus]
MTFYLNADHTQVGCQAGHRRCRPARRNARQSPQSEAASLLSLPSSRLLAPPSLVPLVALANRAWTRRARPQLSLFPFLHHIVQQLDAPAETIGSKMCFNYCITVARSTFPPPLSIPAIQRTRSPRSFILDIFFARNRKSSVRRLYKEWELMTHHTAIGDVGSYHVLEDIAQPSISDPSSAQHLNQSVTQNLAAQRSEAPAFPTSALIRTSPGTAAGDEDDRVIGGGGRQSALGHDVKDTP